MVKGTILAKFAPLESTEVSAWSGMSFSALIYFTSIVFTEFLHMLFPAFLTMLTEAKLVVLTQFISRHFEVRLILSVLAAEVDGWFIMSVSGVVGLLTVLLLEPELSPLGGLYPASLWDIARCRCFGLWL